LSQLKTLQIANWDGFVIGGGVGISIHAPFRIATEKTLFSMPENKLGFFTDVASGHYLSKLRNKLGYYIGVTGLQLKGEDVYNSGLANFFVQSASIPKIYE
jgi:enoyl-CoA hydratase/carnithine racemase